MPSCSSVTASRSKSVRPSMLSAISMPREDELVAHLAEDVGYEAEAFIEEVEHFDHVLELLERRGVLARSRGHVLHHILQASEIAEVKVAEAAAGGTSS